MPPNWEYRYRSEVAEYQFWRIDNPQVSFSLGETALAVYKDQPEKLVELIRRQLSMHELAILARQAVAMTATDGYRKKDWKKLVNWSGQAGICTTPWYCKWRFKHIPGTSVDNCEICRLNVKPRALKSGMS